MLSKHYDVSDPTTFYRSFGCLFLGIASTVLNPVVLSMAGFDFMLGYQARTLYPMVVSISILFAISGLFLGLLPKRRPSRQLPSYEKQMMVIAGTAFAGRMLCLLNIGLYALVLWAITGFLAMD